MSEMGNLPPVPPEQSDVPTRGVLARINEHINWPATVVASLAATACGSVALHETNWRDGSFLDHAKSVLTLEPSYKSREVLGSQITEHTENSYRYRPIQSYVGRTTFNLRTGSQQYARQFSQDPHAGLFTSPKQFNRVIRNLDHLAEDGAKFRTITITGFSSAEDDHANGGLQAPSRRNKELAKFRSESVLSQFRAELQGDPKLKAATKHAKISLGKPVEQNLTDAEVREITKAVHSTTGYANAQDLIESWNTGSHSINPDVDRLLESILGRARKVTINTTWHQPGKTIEARDKYCTIYDTTEITSVTRKHKVPIPLPLPILLPIPLLGLARRKPNKLAETVHEVPTRHEPFEYGAGGRRRTWPEMPRFRKVGGFAIKSMALGASAVALFGFNVSGKNCRGDSHLPIPLIGDMIYDGVRDAFNIGADTQQTFSFGIPFVKSAQIETGHHDYNSWIPDPSKPCRPQTTDVAPTPPRCSTVQITRENGKETNRTLVYQAPPIETKIVRIRQP